MKSISVMKTLTRIWWEAKPVNFMQIYRGLVQSKLYYGFLSIGNAGKEVLKRLDNVQHEALCVPMRYVQSKLINVI